MIPILTTSAMREADARATALRGVDALVALAGTAVGLEAARLLGTCYGKRVAVVVGPGLNGADGRVAATWLSGRGATVTTIPFDAAPTRLDGFDLVVDAAFGLGASRPYVAPEVAPGTMVLAIDLPSGVDADTGAILGSPPRADVTLALGALKPAHLNGPAAALVGSLRFASLGIVEEFEDGLIDDRDLRSLIDVDRDDHKWKHAIQAFVGSSLMPGAADLVLRGALAGGASMIRLASHSDVAPFIALPPEAIHVDGVEVDPRCRAVVAGPGLGPGAPEWLAERLGGLHCPVVLDAAGLDRRLIDETAPHDGSWVLTPHEGEFARLTGEPPGPDRFAEVRRLAQSTGCVVLLKGPTTVIADPAGRLRVVTSGTPNLATAGSGDVLSGLIAATIARGHDVLEAAALAAHLHGRASARLTPYASASDGVRAVHETLRELARVAR